jgi:hypothetical protein
MTSLLRLTFIVIAISATLHAQADSIASSASSAGSDSSGSVSDSIHGSSNSSSNSSKGDKVADRDYHVVDVAMVAGRPGMARVTLQANDSDWRVMVDLPQAIVDREFLRTGALVHAQQRVYGIEFEHGDTHQAFFLALNDDWLAELGARKVSL